MINIKSDWRRSRCQPSLHGKSSDQTRLPYPAAHQNPLPAAAQRALDSGQMALVLVCSEIVEGPSR